jgi:hypothetical protein
MATNTDRPVGPGTFSRDEYSVSIAEDGKIRVKKDDWLSKYSWALYGDYETLDVFVRPNPRLVLPTEEIKGIKAIDDVDLIDTGEYLIHVPTYFHWMEKRGKPVQPMPKPNKPVPPGDVKSMNWTAANLGGLDGTYFLGSAGAVMLAFRNLDNGKTFYFVLLRAGGGIGFSLGDTIEGLRKFFRTIGMALFAQRAATAKWERVIVNLPFSARSAQDLTVRCISWNVSTGGPGQNYSYDKLTGGTSRFDYFSVTFKETNWIQLPGFEAGFTGGALIWVW